MASLAATKETGIETAAVLVSLAVASVPRLVARMQD